MVTQPAIGVAPPLPGRPPAWSIAYDHLGPLLMVLDPLVLVGAALIGHEAHARLVLGIPGDPMKFAAVSAIPTALLLPLLSLNGAYHPDAVADTRGAARIVLPLWLAALAFLWAVVAGLGIEADVDTVGLAIFALTGPAALLLERSVVARAARAAFAAGQVRSPRIFTIAEAPAPGESQISGESQTSSESIAFDRPDALAIASLIDLDRETLDRIVAGIRASGAEEIHLVCQRRSLSECRAILSELRRLPLPVKLVADPGQAELLRCRLVRARGAFAFEVQRAPLSGLERAAKRIFDLVACAVLVLALAPVLAAVAVMIRLTSEGPVLFRQTRNGFNGRPFEIYKFRTMTVQENGPGLVQARRDDPRVTPLGRLLRRSSIDELPQLINVLKGEMSLIGPRPHAMVHDHDFAARVADYALRHHVKPGITGWAQVNGHRGETTTAEAIARRVEYDLRYIERWSLWLDLWIIVRTVQALAYPRNAY